jgi:hypothetical protein
MALENLVLSVDANDLFGVDPSTPLFPIIRRSSQPNRFDESRTVYSLAGCSPAEPASASPADGDIKEEESV